MAMDQTDKQLVNGLIFFVILALLAYFFPSIESLGIYGYSALSEQEREKRDTLKTTNAQYEKYYPPMHPAHFGEVSADPAGTKEGAYIDDLEKTYENSRTQTLGKIGESQGFGRMEFQDWTEVPAEFIANPIVYFVRTYGTRKEVLRKKWIDADIECMDESIGFAKFVGRILTITETKELMRELYIAEKIIELCIGAKKRQEAYEKGLGVKAEAFMRILKVSPQDSVPTGPTALIPNAAYDPKETNPSSPKYRKYNVRTWKSFIQEYPVEIELQCDVNSFERFLHSVRDRGQFLVIRNLEIISPFLHQSPADKTELQKFYNESSPGVGDENKPPPIEDEHIYVRLSAAGMDFFNPETHPNGLYSRSIDATEKSTVRGPRSRKLRPAQ